MPRTRIVCTLGPASQSPEVIRGLLRAGMDVVRINFSHGDHQTHHQTIDLVRAIAKEEGRTVAFLGDLQGPRVRVGPIAGESVELLPGQRLTLTTRPVLGTASLISVTAPTLPRDVRPGDRLLLADGTIVLQVTRTLTTEIETVVEVGGLLRSHQGLNIPGRTLQIPSLTEKDLADLAFALDERLDYIAMSFVRSAQDLRDLKQQIAARGGTARVVAKIEKHEAVRAFDSILAESDAVMVARGDLGVELPLEEVPIVQKEIIRKCNAAGVPVITATQMLNAMIEKPRPTRAEATDVANAILDGTDAVMLSGETAIGRYPVLATETLARLASRAEDYFFAHRSRPVDPAAISVTEAIAQATVEIAAQVQAQAILTLTATGYTARLVSKYRPAVPILAGTPTPETLRALCLVWGVQGFLVPPSDRIDTLLQAAIDGARRVGWLREGQTIVITAGVPLGGPGRTNFLKVHVVGEPLSLAD
jgi:pyruvate kinase